MDSLLNNALSGVHLRRAFIERSWELGLEASSSRVGGTLGGRWGRWEHTFDPLFSSINSSPSLLYPDDYELVGPSDE